MQKSKKYIEILKEKKDKKRGNVAEKGMSKSDARETFNFMADNTDVEWGYMESKGENGSNFMVGTSHSDAGEEPVARALNKLENGTLIRYNHNHPANDYDPNWSFGYRPSTRNTTANENRENNDIDFWQGALQKHPNASFGIRFNGNMYHYYKEGKPYGTFK